MNNKRILAVAVASSVSLSGCKTMDTAKDMYGSALEVVSEHSSTLTGCLGGAVIGAATGYLTNGKDGALAGGVIGLTTGCYIGYKYDEKRRALEAVAEERGLSVTYQPIAATESEVKDEDGQVIKQAEFTIRDDNPRAKNNDGAVVGLSASINAKGMFKSGSANYSSQEYADDIKAIAVVYIKTEQEARNKDGDDAFIPNLMVTGHSDGSGSDQLNMKLSLKRAKKVATTLVEAGVSPERIYIKGAGESQPVSTNSTKEGRAKNRRVEITEVMTDEKGLLRLAEARTYSTNNLVHRSGDIAREKVAKAPSVKVPSKSVKPLVDFGGGEYDDESANNIWSYIQKAEADNSWSFFSKANADDALKVSCLYDRPVTESGMVKYSTGKEVSSDRPKTSDYLPGAYGNSWYDKVNGHLLAVNKVAVVRSGYKAYGNPEVAVYTNYSGDKSAKADYLLKSTSVNVYSGDQALLYRIFINDKKAPIQCIDMVLPKSAPYQSPSSTLVYGNAGEYLKNFTPKTITKNNRT